MALARCRVVLRSLPYVAAGLVAAGVVFYHLRDTPRAQAQNPAPAPAANAVVSRVTPAADVEAAHDEGVPSSLAGTTAPRLPTDASGHLERTRAVRDFFDYYLSARGDSTDRALDALINREIAAQLGRMPARQEATQVWQRYGRYLAELAALSSDGAPPSGKFDASALSQAFDVRAALARRTLGDWYEPFFGAEQQQQRFDLARLQIVRDASLSDAQKAARLAALAEQASPAQRDEDKTEQQQRDALAQIAQLQQSRAAPDEIRTQITQSLGPAVAERVVAMQAEETAWQSRYDDYAAQRAQIDAQNLPDQTHDALVEQLRQRMFTAPGEALRAASLDRNTAPPPPR